MNIFDKGFFKVVFVPSAPCLFPYMRTYFPDGVGVLAAQSAANTPKIFLPSPHAGRGRGWGCLDRNLCKPRPIEPKRFWL